MKLLVSDYEVSLGLNDMEKGNFNSEFYVKLNGPANSPYENVSFSKEIRIFAIFNGILHQILSSKI